MRPLVPSVWSYETGSLRLLRLAQFDRQPMPAGLLTGGGFADQRLSADVQATNAYKIVTFGDLLFPPVNIAAQQL